MSQSIKFDVRSLEATNIDASTKVNFTVEKLSTYKEAFLKAVEGANEIILTGPGPVWLFCSLWHEAHGRVADGKLIFEAPGVGQFEPQAAGVASGKTDEVVDGKIVIDISSLEAPPEPGQRLNFSMNKVTEYQAKALERIPAFKVGETYPEFEIILTGPGPVWLYLALCAALHSRGGRVLYAAPNAPSVVLIDHK